MTCAAIVISAATVTTQLSTNSSNQAQTLKMGSTNLVAYVLNEPDTGKYVAISPSQRDINKNTIIPIIAYPINAPKAPAS